MCLNVATNLTELQVPSLSTFTGCSKYLFTSIVTIFTTCGGLNSNVNIGVSYTECNQFPVKLREDKILWRNLSH